MPEAVNYFLKKAPIRTFGKFLNAPLNIRAEAWPGPRQTSKMECFVSIVNS